MADGSKYLLWCFCCRLSLCADYSPSCVFGLFLTPKNSVFCLRKRCFQSRRTSCFIVFRSINSLFVRSICLYSNFAATNHIAATTSNTLVFNEVNDLVAELEQIDEIFHVYVISIRRPCRLLALHMRSSVINYDFIHAFAYQLFKQAIKSSTISSQFSVWRVS